MKKIEEFINKYNKFELLTYILSIVFITYLILGFLIYLQNKEIDILKTEVKYKIEIINILEKNNKELQNYLTK
jgi:flagellar biosynthesis/type III secretory pathway M-ring protein FliF/YscJ